MPLSSFCLRHHTIPTHTQHLLQLDLFTALWELPNNISRVESPLVIDRWVAWLQRYPGQQLAKYVLKGISTGFRIIFNYSNSLRRTPCVNLLSAFQNPQVVSKHLEEEKELGRIIGPLEAALAHKVHTKLFGVISKQRHSLGKW